MSFNSPNFSLAKVNEPRWENCVTADDLMIAWHEETDFPLISWSAQAEAFFEIASHRMMLTIRRWQSLLLFILMT
ncbi:hypothetical protein LOS25_15815 [Enterococcus faecium]|nr:hypothetical protein [Enterococcus faecium]